MTDLLEYLPPEQQARVKIRRDADRRPLGRPACGCVPPPEVIAQEIVEELEAALAEFAAIAESLSSTTTGASPTEG